MSLLLSCKNCDHQEDASEPCVYRNNIQTLPLEKQAIPKGLSTDPTLPRTDKRPCPVCGHREAVFFQAHDRRRDTPMTLFFVCCNENCSHFWSE